MSSLSIQLQNLKTGYLYEENGVFSRYSLIYDATKAKTISKEMALTDAQSGLEELILIDKNFETFKESLFNPESLTISRVNTTNKENKILNKEIDRFLYLIAPYLMLNSAHSTIEWLLFKYSINIYNQESYVLLFLPYHETKLFSRAIMLIDCKNPTSVFHWLFPAQLEGYSLNREVLIRQLVQNKGLVIKCLSHISFLSSYITRLKDSGDSHSIIYSFFSALFICFVDVYDSSFDQTVDMMLPYLLEALQSELPNYCYTGLTIINKLTDVVHLQPKYLFSVAEKIISSAILDPKTKILSMICLTNRQDISEFSLTFLQSLFQLEDFYNLFDTLDGVNFENFSRSVFISSIKNIEKIQQYEFDPQFLHFIDISLHFSQLIYVYAEKIVEYMKENEFTKIISDVVAILVKNNSDISKYFKNCSNPNILSYLAKFQSENSSNGDLIVSKTCSVKLICKKLMKSYEQKINLTLNELDRVISILTRNTTFSIFKLFSLSPEIITFNFDILTMNKIRSAAARVLSSFPCQSLSILNEKYNAMFIDGSLIGDIFNCPLSVIHIIPIILKELKCSIGDRHLIFLLSKNPPFYSPLLISVLNAIQIGIEDPLEFLASLECDNEVLANLLTQIDQLIYDTDVIFAIALIKIKINISLDKIPCYLSKLYDLIFKKMSIKCHKKESISDIVLSKKMTKLCLESSSNSHDVLIDTILWSIYNLFDCLNDLDSSVCINEQLNMLEFFIQVSYAHSAHKNFSIKFYDYFKNFINTKFQDKDFFLALLTQYIVRLSDISELHTDLRNQLLIFTFLMFIRDILASTMFNQSKSVIQLIVPLFSQIQNRNRDIRILIIDILNFCKSFNFDKNHVHLLEYILKNRTLLENDNQTIISIFSRLFQKSNSISDYCVDLFISQIKSGKLNFVNLFCLKCLITFKSHPDLISLLFSYVKAILDIPTTPIILLSRFAPVLDQFFTNLSPQECTSQESFSIITSWSVSDIQLESEFLSALAWRRIRTHLFSLFNPIQKKFLLCECLKKIAAKKHASTFIGNEIKKLPVDCSFFLSLMISFIRQNQPNAMFVNRYYNSKKDSFPSEVLTSEIFTFLMETLSNINNFANQQIFLSFLFEFANFVSNVMADKETIFLGQSPEHILELTLESCNNIILNVLQHTTKLFKVETTLNFKNIVNILRRNHSYSTTEICLNILANSSKLCPELLLDYLMPMFTFMGSCSVKRDDEQTLANISRAIKAIIPHIQDKLDKNSDESIFKILDTFSNSFVHVPKHRHQHLFESLICSFSSVNSLGIVAYSLLEHNKNTEHIYEFICELCFLFPVIKQLDAMLFVLQRVSQILDTPSLVHAGSKRKNTACESVSNFLPEKAIKLINRLLTSDAFKEKIILIDPVDYEEFDRIYVAIIRLLIGQSHFWLSNINSLFLDKLLITLVSYGNPIRFLESVNLLVLENEPSYCVNFLHNWSATTIYQEYEFENIFISTTNILVESIIKESDKFSNYLTLCKKSIFTIKNFAIKLKNSKSCLCLFEKMIECHEYMVRNRSLIASLIWSISECFKILSYDISIYIPKIMKNLIKVQTIIENQKQSLHSEIIFKCLKSIFEKYSVPVYDEYLLQIFLVIYRSTKPSCIFNDFEAIISNKNLSRFESHIFGLLYSLSSKLSTEILILCLYNFLNSLPDFGSEGIVYLIFLVHSHIVRSNQTSIESNNQLYEKLLLLLFNYRYNCVRQSIIFNKNIESKFIHLFYKYSLKQKESSFMEIYSKFYDEALNENNDISRNQKLTTFYDLSSFLFQKIRNLLIPFITNVVKDSIINQLQSFTVINSFVKSSLFDSFISICQTIKYMLMYDTNGQIPSNMLLNLIDPLMDILLLSSNEIKEISDCLQDHIVPSFGYLSVCLKPTDFMPNLLGKLQNTLSSGKCDEIRRLTLLSVDEIFKKFSDSEAQLYITHIPLYSSHLNCLLI